MRTRPRILPATRPSPETLLPRRRRGRRRRLPSRRNPPRRSAGAPRPGECGAGESVTPRRGRSREGRTGRFSRMTALAVSSAARRMLSSTESAFSSMVVSSSPKCTETVSRFPARTRACEKMCWPVCCSMKSRRRAASTRAAYRRLRGRGRGHVHDLPVLLAHLHDLRAVERAVVTRLPAAARVEAGAVQHDLGPAVRERRGADHGGVELEAAGLGVVQLFRHCYGIPSFVLLDKASDGTLG